MRNAKRVSVLGSVVIVIVAVAVANATLFRPEVVGDSEISLEKFRK